MNLLRIANSASKKEDEENEEDENEEDEENEIIKKTETIIKKAET